MIRVFFLLVFVPFLYSQNSFTARVLDSTSSEPLIGVNVVLKGTTRGAVTDKDGFVRLTEVENGTRTFVFSAVGYAECEQSFTFPPSIRDMEIRLQPEAEEMEEVVVSATRLSRHIDDIPTRVEAITEEELDEKASMNSSNLSMVLNESTGISVQTTSPTSGNANIRIQGLDGRYTQIVKDGFPLYGGLSSGLSIMQTPPLDLRQVEVVKGSASTIYGGGAIAGLINLVSRGPAKEREINVMLDQSSAGGTTANTFVSDRHGSWAYTLFGSANRQMAYDADDDGYSDIPRVSSIHIKPVYYLEGEATRVSFGVDGFWEDRRGGRVRALKNGADGYLEKNVSHRATSLLKVEQDRAGHHQWTFKNSVSSYARQTVVPDFRFEGHQWSTFSEFTAASLDERSPWIAGGMIVSDHFDERNSEDPYSTDYRRLTFGAFGQYTWSVHERLFIESGMRFDHQNRYGWFILPRISLLYKFDRHWSARAGAGMGYREPTIFNEEAETVHFMNVRRVDHRTAKAERSVGGNLDMNFNGIVMDKIGFSLNQLFYYTSIRDPLGINADSALHSVIAFETLDGTLVTRGAETNVKLSYAYFKLFLGYTLTYADKENNGRTAKLPLIPTHRLNSVLMVEMEGRWRLGYEAYYTGSQRRRDGQKVRDYWIMGVMGERKWEHFSVYVNFENFLDTRQSRYEKIIPPDNPSPTTDIWAPLEGFTINGGVKFRL